MLKNLHIKNYALIENLEVEFDAGLNIITGETGAGKSIIIDALSLILGERADTDTIRKGTEKAIVEGIFDIKRNIKIKNLLNENQIETANEIILRREVSIKGASRCFINDVPVSLTLLKNAGELLVDLHGQHEHQSLLKPETHIDFLDDFAGLVELVNNFRELYNKLLSEIEYLKKIESREKQLQEKKDLYQFQLNEINLINPSIGEEEKLEAEVKILENSEKINELATKLYQQIYDDDSSIINNLGNIRRTLQQLIKIDNSLNNLIQESESAESILKEIAFTLRSYLDAIEFNPEKLEQLRTRLGEISLLKKKYGGTIESVIEYKNKLIEELKLSENFADEIKKTKEKIEQTKNSASRLARELSINRKAAAKLIDSKIVSELSHLGINNSKFETIINNRKIRAENHINPFIMIEKSYYETTPKGIDFVEFYISTNIGEDLKSLTKVASGGEISRIMLALKTILAKSMELPLLIFDEIDIGISGRIAQVVGLSLKNLSKFHQIIAITHLPQIAAFADSHFVVNKNEISGRTKTIMKKLNTKERIYEVAKLLSGSEITESALKSAKELIDYKNNCGE